MKRMPELRMFYDLVSQPCRAVVMFLDANKIPYESAVIKIAEGDCSHYAYTDLWAYLFKVIEGA